VVIALGLVKNGLFMYTSKLTGKILNHLVAFRWKNVSWVRLLVSLFFLFCFTFPALSFSAEKLFILETPEKQQGIVNHAGPKLAAAIHKNYVVEFVLAKVRPSVIREQSKDIEINLSQRLSVVAHKLRVSNQDGMPVWHGGLPDKRAARVLHLPNEEVPVDPFNTVTLVRHNGNVTGLVRVHGDIYEVVPAEGGEHVIIKVDPQKLPPESKNDVVPVSMPEKEAVGRLSNVHSTHSTIRVMVALTNDVKNTLEDAPGLVALAFALANEGNVNSHAPITFENAGILYPNYNESGGGSNNQSAFYAMLYNILGQKYDDQPEAPELTASVHAFRDEHRADLVTMLVKNKAICGLAFPNSTKATAFSVTNYGCATDQLSFAHEMGHNLGAYHDRYADTSTRVPPYSHGYVQLSQTPRWRTILAYSGICPGDNCPKINYWSNPQLTWNGLHMGTAEFEDVVRLINERREIVEGFYPPPAEILPPVAQATAIPASVSGEMQVSLDGSASSNPSGGSLQYEWTQVSGPPPAVTIEDSTSKKASVTIPAVEQSSSYVFKLVVTNSHSLSDSKTVMVNATPPPTGNCGNVSAWDASKRYTNYGEEVFYLGKVYRHNFESTNKPPDLNSAPWGQPWVYLRDCPASYKKKKRF
jgi:peptidyl-Asp metalloendopeptidase